MVGGKVVYEKAPGLGGKLPRAGRAARREALRERTGIL
jgi:hypothetical protein